MIGVAAVALASGAMVRRHADPAVVVSFVLVGFLAPVPLAAVGFLVWAVMRFREAADVSRRRLDLETAALEAGDLIGLGLAGGLGTAAAFRLAQEHCAPVLTPDMGAVVSSMGRHGVAAALGLESGPLAGIARAIGSATASGAPALVALDAHLRQEHHRHHTRQVEKARRLPVRLLLPLTLLVLPGFVLITVGPAVVDSLARLNP